MSALHSIEVWLVTLVITVAVLAGFGIFARWCTLSPAVPQDRLDKLRVGMTSDEVVALLGEPRDNKVSRDGHRQWFYGARMKRHVLVVQFTTHNTVESFNHGVPNARRSASRTELT